MKKSNERGFAIIAAALLVALSVMFGLGAIVVVEHSRLVEEASRVQRLQSVRATEDLSLTAVGTDEIEVTNKGALPSFLVAYLIKKQDGSLEAHKFTSPAEFVGAFEKKTLTLSPTLGGNDKIGILTQLGNVFWINVPMGDWTIKTHSEWVNATATIENLDVVENNLQFLYTAVFQDNMENFDKWVTHVETGGSPTGYGLSTVTDWKTVGTYSIRLYYITDSGADTATIYISHPENIQHTTKMVVDLKHGARNGGDLGRWSGRVYVNDQCLWRQQTNEVFLGKEFDLPGYADNIMFWVGHDGYDRDVWLWVDNVTVFGYFDSGLWTSKWYNFNAPVEYHSLDTSASIPSGADVSAKVQVSDDGQTVRDETNWITLFNGLVSEDISTLGYHQYVRVLYRMTMGSDLTMPRVENFTVCVD